MYSPFAAHLTMPGCICCLFAHPQHIHTLCIITYAVAQVLSRWNRHSQSSLESVQTLSHFRPKTLRHHQDGSETNSELSGQFGTSAKVSVQHFSNSAELSAVRPLFNMW